MSSQFHFHAFEFKLFCISSCYCVSNSEFGHKMQAFMFSSIGLCRNRACMKYMLGGSFVNMWSHRSHLLYMKVSKCETFPLSACVWSEPPKLAQTQAVFLKHEHVAHWSRYPVVGLTEKNCVFKFVVFVYFFFTLGKPLSETLFFRGAQQLHTH